MPNIRPQRRRLRAASFILAFAACGAFAQDNPLARRSALDPRSILPGAWNGANLEQRSNCSAPQNNGNRGTYAAYDVSFDPLAGTMGINETAITGLTCSYIGAYDDTDRFRPTWTGTYNCSDGKTGNFQSTNVLATPNEMSVRLSIKLTGSETCDVNSIVGGSRF